MVYDDTDKTCFWCKDTVLWANILLFPCTQTLFGNQKHRISPSRKEYEGRVGGKNSKARIIKSILSRFEFVLVCTSMPSVIPPPGWVGGFF